MFYRLGVALVEYWDAGVMGSGTTKNELKSPGPWMNTKLSAPDKKIILTW